MLFNDIYVGTPFGQAYPDLIEIINRESRLDEKDMLLSSEIGFTLESILQSRIDLNGPVYS